MTIQGPSSNPLRRTAETPIATPAVPAVARQVAGGAAGRTDQVEISAAARALSGDFAPAASRDEVRARIASGAYNTPEAAEALARRLLSSGDL